MFAMPRNPPSRTRSDRGDTVFGVEGREGKVILGHSIELRNVIKLLQKN